MATVQREPIFWYLHDNIEHFCIADSYSYTNNNKKGIYFCVSMTTVVTRMRQNVTCVRRLSCLF